MAEKKKYDGVIEAVHYRQNGQVDWVRAYMRRGSAWSDHVVIKRDELIKEIKSGKQMIIGQRVDFMAGTFELSFAVQITGADGQENLTTSAAVTGRDHLEGMPVL